MTAWLLQPPAPLTRRQQLVLWCTAAFVALSRLFAISKSMWEWDEALFALALREYDIVDHRPHPPGFPLFIGAAKVLRLLVPSDFHALQVITVAAAIALFPLLFFLARELRFPFPTSILGPLLFAFFPNVWFFGGTAFSDVPALALAVAASIFFLRGARSDRAFLAAAILLGMTLSIRPQNMILVLVPASLGTLVVLRRSWKVVAGALVAGLAVVALSYGGAAFASRSPGAFFEMVRSQQKYVRDVDSVFNPGRPPLGELFQDFIREPMRAGDRATALAILAVAGIVAIAFGANRAGGTVVLSMFVPMAVFSWLMLDVAAVTRYTVSSVAGHALLAAHGTWWLLGFARTYRPLVQTVVVGGLAAAYAWWALPGIREVRRNDAPPAAVMLAARRVVPPDAPLYVKSGLGPFATYYLEERGRKVTFFENEREVPADPNAWIIVDAFVRAGDGAVFSRDDARTYQFARRRYFVASVVPVGAITRFGAGWYDEETYGHRTMRWMGSRGEMELQPARGRMELELEIRIPTPLITKRPNITVVLNGAVVDRYAASQEVESRRLIVNALEGRPNSLVITTDQVVNPVRERIGSDRRDLGLQLRSYVWRPVS